jgi:hypothetical protein
MLASMCSPEVARLLTENPKPQQVSWGVGRNKHSRLGVYQLDVQAVPAARAHEVPAASSRPSP